MSRNLLKICFAILAVTTIIAKPVSVLAAEEEGVETDPSFIEFAPVSVSVVHNNRVAGFLSLAFGVMVEDPVAAAKVESLLPKISDACVRMLARIARTRLDVTESVNIELLRAYLQRTVDSVVGENVATVLIQDATLQPR